MILIIRYREIVHRTCSRAFGFPRLHRCCSQSRGRSARLPRRYPSHYSSRSQCAGSASVMQTLSRGIGEGTARKASRLPISQCHLRWFPAAFCFHRLSSEPRGTFAIYRSPCDHGDQVAALTVRSSSAAQRPPARMSRRALALTVTTYTSKQVVTESIQILAVNVFAVKT